MLSDAKPCCGHLGIIVGSYRDHIGIIVWPSWNHCWIKLVSFGDYVCVEPWLGYPDHENTNQNIKTKEGILELEVGKSFEASYNIEIQDSHLN